MAIEASSLISLLSGTQTTANPLLAASAQNGGGTDFLTALLDQLQQGQASSGSDKTTGIANILQQLDSQQTSSQSGIDAQQLQQFAALLGNQMPQTQAVNDPINLDNTFSTLSGVVQSLQQLQQQPAEASLLLTANTGMNNLVAANTKNSAATESANTTASDNSGDAPSAATNTDNSNAIATDPLLALLLQQQQALTPAAQPNPQAQLPELATSDSSVIQNANNQSGNVLTSAIRAASNNIRVNLQTKPANSATALLQNSNPAENTSLIGQLQNPAHQNQNAAQQQPVTALSDEEKAQANALKALSAELSANSRAQTSDLSPPPLTNAADGLDKTQNSFNQTLQQLSQSITVPTGSAPTASANSNQPAISQYVGNSQWGEALGDKLTWMHHQNVPSAEIRLNPEHLGPLTVKIDVQHDQTNISFTTQHQAVKEAIESALPKLREMLGGQQLSLGDVNVSQQNAEQQQSKAFFQMANDGQQGQQKQQAADPDTSSASEATSGAEPINAAHEPDNGTTVTGNGLLSLFA
jgi:flagellar hook-length control protein FliK